MHKNIDSPSLFDFDARAATEDDYSEYEALFAAAYEYNFCERATPRRLQAYLQRYFRYGLVPPWVRTYVREVLDGVAIDNIGHAPLDPAFDLRQWLRQWQTHWLFPDGLRRSLGGWRGDRFEA